MEIKIITELPGPKAKKVLAQNEEYRYPGRNEVGLVMEKGVGVFLVDVDGNTFLDFASGIAVLNTGSCHPLVIKAVQDQVHKFVHSGGLNFCNIQVELAKKLAQITPGSNEKKVYFSNSGAEGVEAAIKLARYKTRRPGIISFINGFHGRTYGAASITTSKIAARQYYSPLIGDIYFAHFPYCYRCPINLEYPECDLSCLNYLESVIFKKMIAPDEIAAIIVEPIQGEGGYVVPPKEFHPRLKSLAEKYGILYVADEIQTGMGRTGKWFAIEHWNGIEPDIITFAKGVASGMPLGGIIGTKETFKWASDAHGSTFGGNPVSCAAALATISVIESELLENASTIGNFILEKLNNMKDRYEVIGDIRGKGLMIGIEIVDDKKSKNASKEKRDRILKSAFKKGLSVVGCGENIVRIAPPLIINQDEAEMGIKIIESCISDL